MSVLSATIIPPSSHVSATEKRKLFFVAEGGEIAKVVMNDGLANFEDGNRSQHCN